MATYQFPTSGFQTRQSDPTSEALVLILCGSFNPITTLHLHLFSSAIDYCHNSTHGTNFELVGCYISPVSDAYHKPGLISANYRLAMAELATEEFKGNGEGRRIMVDDWESLQPGYTSTARVLDHFDHEINGVLGGVVGTDGTKRPVRIALLAGADLVLDMSTPGRWSREDLDHIFGRYGVFVVERKGTDIDGAIGKLRHAKEGENIWKVEPLVKNDVSSTKVRLQLRWGMSVGDLPASVVTYIKEHGLYREDPEEAEALVEACSEQESNIAKQ